MTPITEPRSIALLLTTCGVLLLASVLFSRTSQRIGVPVVLVFMLLGMLSGSEGIGGIVFDNYRLAFRLGSVALAAILFDGGLNTSLSSVRSAWAPAGVLATAGVAMTALLLASFARLWGLGWPEALLLGAVVSSTDAAAVFSVLRGSGLHLKRRVGVTLELESGINDPAAVILTIALTGNLMAGGSLGVGRIALDIVVQLAVGAAVGLAVGYAGRELLKRLQVPTGGLYPAVTLALAFLAFGLATLLDGSGFLAVYLAGLILGNGPLPYRTGLLRVHDALAWLSQIGMFLILGLLVYPSRLAAVAKLGLALALLLAIVIRPLTVSLLLLPFRYPAKEVAFMGWVGLRGAVPIVLATYPVLVGAPGAEQIFHLVFFIVVVNALIPGGTVARATRALGLATSGTPAPPAVLAIESRQPLKGEVLSYHIDEALLVAGVPLEALEFPEGAAVALIVRGNELVAPRPSTVLQPGDHVYIVARPEDRAIIQLMFGRPEED